jgi:hypothetical protein
VFTGTRSYRIVAQNEPNQESLHANDRVQHGARNGSLESVPSQYKLI